VNYKRIKSVPPIHWISPYLTPCARPAGTAFAYFTPPSRLLRVGRMVLSAQYLVLSDHPMLLLLLYRAVLSHFSQMTQIFPLFLCRFIFISYFCRQSVCHENKSAVCRVVVRNFGRDGGRPTTFGEQALIVNHFMLLWWKQMGSERWIESLPVEVGKVWDKEVSESKPFDEASLANQATSEPGFVSCSGIMAEETCIAVCWVCGV
jgi:hypothetical protein